MKDTVNGTVCDLCGAKIQKGSFARHRDSQQCKEMAQHRADVKRDECAKYAKVNHK